MPFVNIPILTFEILSGSRLYEETKCRPISGLHFVNSFEDYIQPRSSMALTTLAIATIYAASRM